MKTLFRYTSLILLAAMTVVMAACSSDDDAVGAEQRADGKVPVKIRLHVAGQGGDTQTSTRAPWQDVNATDDEMMNVWVVYCIDNDPQSQHYGEPVFIHTCMPVDANREIDDLVYLPRGKYAFYSFANIHPRETNTLMGIEDLSNIISPLNSDGTLGDAVTCDYNFFDISDDNTHKGVVYSVPWPDHGIKIKYHDDNNGEDIGMYTSMVWGADGFFGNGLDPTAANCFSSKGIPMSNYQEIEITGEANVDLIVVRMVAKIELQITNEATYSITVKNASLTDVTLDGSGQICVFPNLNNAGTGHEHQMNFTHKDIKPHISDEAFVGGYTHPVNKTIAAGETEIVTFYVNESKAPKNASGLFYLSLGFDMGNNEVEYHHALINQKGSTTTDNNAWDYIARNDYRIIPIHLTDWLFRIEPLAFVPIAGYPAVTLSSDALKATFNTGGMIALQPFVKKKTDATWRDFDDVEVTYGEVVADETDPTKDDVEKSWNASISWKNSNGVKQSGAGKILTTPFTYDPTTKCIIGELNNNLPAGTYKTAVTVNVKLGPSGNQYTYSFTCDVVLQK